MKDVADIAKWLLEKDIRAKNAVSVFGALFSVVVVYFVSKDRQWFQEIKSYGAIGVAVALFVVFLMSFLGVWLLWSAVAASHHHVTAQQRREDEAEKRQKAIRDNLDSLTDWQRGFLLRFITESQNQISEYKVGGHKAVWDSEMQVLVNKRIVKHHLRAGVYEIEPVYRNYLIEHWDADSGTPS